MKTIKIIIDKLRACYQILSHKEYILFYTDMNQEYDDSQDVGCWFSYGMLENNKFVKLFKESIAEFMSKDANK